MTQRLRDHSSSSTATKKGADISTRTKVAMRQSQTDGDEKYAEGVLVDESCDKVWLLDSKNKTLSYSKMMYEVEKAAVR
jgi:hypothetical protein